MLAPHPPSPPPVESVDLGGSSPQQQPARAIEAALAGSTAERLHVVVAGVHGRFRPLVTNGRVLAGTLLGHVTGGGRRDEVRAPVHLDVQGLLARPGQLVAPGQALVWAEHVEAAA